MSKTTQYWENLADTISIPSHAYIDGQFVGASDGGVNASTSPIDGRSTGDVPMCTAHDTNRAVQVARDAFESGVWSRLSASRRKNKMLDFAHVLEQHIDELALLDTLDMGKPIAYALDDVESSVAHYRWMAEAAEKKTGDVLESNPRYHTTCSYEPVGVVGAVVPWNFPFNMAAWKLAPSLCTGNSVIIKPAEVSSHSLMRMAQLWDESGMPKGVFQVVTGKGSVVGDTLARHHDVDIITFTGSTQVARGLLVASGQSNMKRVYVEAGGKSPAIVLADADLDVTIPNIAGGIFYNQGEVCCATSRAIVHTSLKEEFVTRLKEEAKSWLPSNPFDPDCVMGAVVDSKQLNTINGFIHTGKKQNTYVDMGFEDHLKSMPNGDKGCYTVPTIFDNVQSGDEIFDNEIFGPVLAISTFDTEDEALALANNSIYGLGASVYTQNIKSAHTFTRGVKSGTVWVNCYGAGNDATPFGGYKQSGNGRDRSLHALDKYQELKTSVWKIS